jgi:hypothetical protein
MNALIVGGWVSIRTSSSRRQDGDRAPITTKNLQQCRNPGLIGFVFMVQLLNFLAESYEGSHACSCRRFGSKNKMGEVKSSGIVGKDCGCVLLCRVEVSEGLSESH